MSAQPQPPTGRAIAILRAVAGHRAEMSSGADPDLRIDGLRCCDQFTARHLCRAGLVQQAGTIPEGQWATAELTQAGWHAIGEVRAAA